MLCDAGRFSNAAKLQKQIAEIHESHDNKEDALESYRQAADYFSGENQASSANNMLLKVAQLSAQLERYEVVTMAKRQPTHELIAFGPLCVDTMRPRRSTKASPSRPWNRIC